MYRLIDDSDNKRQFSNDNDRGYQILSCDDVVEAVEDGED